MVTEMLLTPNRLCLSRGHRFGMVGSMRSRFVLSAASFILLNANLARAEPGVGSTQSDQNWIGTWAASPQAGLPGTPKTYRKQNSAPHSAYERGGLPDPDQVLERVWRAIAGDRWRTRCPQDGRGGD